MVMVMMQMALQTVRLLLKHGASIDLLCDGHSPLSLAVISGNDMVCCLSLVAISFHLQKDLNVNAKER